MVFDCAPQRILKDIPFEKPCYITVFAALGSHVSRSHNLLAGMFFEILNILPVVFMEQVSCFKEF